MPVTADTLRLHFDYSAWASQRLMEAAGKLSPEELARDFKTSDKNVLDTLVHVFAADRLWLSRVQGAQKRSEGGTGGGRRPAPAVLSRIRQGVLSAPSNHMGLRPAKP